MPERIAMPRHCLSLFEVTFVEVAALVALLLRVAGVDRAGQLLPAMRDLVVALRDGGRDAARPQPGSVRLR